jgi:hypothetical protein
MQNKHRNKIAGDDAMTKNIKVDDVYGEFGDIGKLSESYSQVIRHLISNYRSCQLAKIGKSNSFFRRSSRLSSSYIDS